MASQEIWLSRLLGDMTGEEPQQVKLLVDNKSAIALSKNLVHDERSKHIDLRYDFFWECIEDGKAQVDHIGTNGQLADVLTTPSHSGVSISLR